MQYVVIGTHPDVDTSVAVGPFRSLEKAAAADAKLTAKGYVSETCTLYDVDELEPLHGEDY